MLLNWQKNKSKTKLSLSGLVKNCRGREIVFDFRVFSFLTELTVQKLHHIACASMDLCA
jgi:hypothetical protein